MNERIKCLIVVFCLVGLFLNQLPKGSYYIVIAIILFLLSLIVFIQDKKSLFGFLILSSMFNNLLDELFFCPTKIQINEIVLVIILPIVWYFKYRVNDK